MQKKWLVMTVCLLLLAFAAGCGTNAGEVSPSASNTPPTASAGTAQPSASPSASTAPTDDGQKRIMDSFRSLLKMAGNEKAVLAKMRQDISKLSPENADEMILAFEAYQKETISQAAILSDELIKLVSKAEEPYNEKILNDVSKITNADLKIMLQQVFDRGYKLIVPEGMYEAVINYGVYKDFEKYVSPDIAAYIGIMAKESESRMSEDAAIIIPIDEVFARTLASESFIKTYPDSVKLDQVKERYAIYVDAWFFGQNNTPAFAYDTDKLEQEFRDSYEKAVQSGKDSAVVKAAADYLKVLDNNDDTLTPAVTEYRKSMTDTLKK